MKYTAEQLATLMAEAGEIELCCDVLARNDAFMNHYWEDRIAIAARRIAEIVMPQDLRYAPATREDGKS